MKNQKALFEQIDLLRTWFNYGVGIANSIAACFKNNRELCEMVPKSLIFNFGDVLQQR